MRIVVTGNSGTGKTTTRLMLRSMLPHYTVIIVNVEMELFLQLPQDPQPTQIETPDVVEWIADYVTHHDNVIVSMLYFFDKADQHFPYDLVLYMACEYNIRRERVIKRSSIPKEDWNYVDDVLSTQPQLIQRTPEILMIDNSGTLEQLTNTLIDLVDQLQIRLDTIAYVDI